MDAQTVVGTLSSARWQRLKDLFSAAIALEPAARPAFAAAACAGDSTLEESLVALLDHHDSVPHSDISLLSPEQMAMIVGAGLRTFLPGELVSDRFRIERFLAQGGMGEVYVAEDLELGERVALKTIRPELASYHQMLARFKREIQLARKVTDRHVSRIFDLCFHRTDRPHGPQTVVFLSMEFLNGESLADRIRRLGPLAPTEAERIVVQLVAGLDAAHRAGIIHRDFKSANVVLVSEAEGNNERAVIMDFGLASPFDAAAPLRGNPGLIGTPAYIAPEQILNGPLTPALDVYALGVVMFEMISGQVPFRGATPQETARLRLERDAPLLRSVAPEAPVTWERTIKLCLQREPSQRPATALEVEARLTGRFERRRRLRVLAGAAVLTAMSGGAWYWTQLPYRPQPDAQAKVDSARVKLENITRPGFLQAIAEDRDAIKIDPNWAQPWAEMAYAYAAAANAQHIPASTARVEARAAALRAIELDPGSARGHGALGWVQSLDFDDWPNAEATLQRAVQLDPSDGRTRFWLGVHLRKKGRLADAERETQRALDLTRRTEPAYWCELAFLYWTFGRLDRMETVMNDLLVAHPNFGFTRFLHARLLKERGRFDEALGELEFSERLQYAAVTVQAERASIQAWRGDHDGARAALDALTTIARKQPVDTLLIAGVYARLGDHDRALAWLERGFEQRDSTLLSIATSPVLKPLRSHPRFQALCLRLHFTAPTFAF